MNLRTITYNCQSFKCNIDIIRDLSGQCDILFLQETLLNDYDIHNLATVNHDFFFYATSSIRKEGCFTGRSSGGLAILIHKKYSLICEELQFSDRILGFFLNFDNKKYLLINIYCPCDYRNEDSYIKFMSTMNDLSNICQTYAFDEIIVAGDFNCDPIRGRFFSQATSFMERHSLVMVDLNRLPNDSFTYVSSNAACSTSWLDHIICSSQELINNITIMYHTTFYDHIPLLFDVIVPIVEVNLQEEIFPELSYILWDKLQDRELFNFQNNLDACFDNFIPDSFLCGDRNCCDKRHVDELEKIYSNILECTFYSSSHMYNKAKPKFKTIPGWNEHCKNLYAISRDLFLKWIANGRMRTGHLFDEMKLARNSFRRSMNFCKNNENEIVIDKIAFSFYGNNNNDEFWKKIKSIKGKKGDVCTISIDGITCNKEISKVFSSQYKSVLADACSVPNNSEPSFNVASDDVCNTVFSVDCINNAILKLKEGQGWDGVHSNHLKFSGQNFRSYLSIFFASLMRHNYLPKQMLKGKIKPVLKGNCTSKSKSANYRPIMSSSMFLKIFEYCLLPIIVRNVNICPRQFGFRPATSCMYAISLVQETIRFYNKGKSDVHCALVDLSKAFDKIVHEKMILKLKKTALPVSVTRIIAYMLMNTYVNVTYNNETDQEWLITNGTRQGGILSPILFSIYINDILNTISTSGIGCKLGYSQVNILCYADDIILLAPSSKGLQIIVDKLECYFTEMNLVMNVSKSAYIVFKHNIRLERSSKIFFNGEEMPRVKNCRYLGVILCENGSIGPDVERCCNMFLRQFNSFYYKLHFLNRNILAFLFKSFCSSFYGIELWHSVFHTPKKYDRLSICYHKAVKRLSFMNVWDSNHAACQNLGVPIFKHLLSEKSLNCFLGLLSSDSPCMAEFKNYFRYSSAFSTDLNQLFKSVYGINNIHANDLDAIKSRISYVERNEPRSTYCFR